jgi:hypothetical protein
MIFLDEAIIQCEGEWFESEGFRTSIVNDLPINAPKTDVIDHKFTREATRPTRTGGHPVPPCVRQIDGGIDLIAARSNTSRYEQKTPLECGPCARSLKRLSGRGQGLSRRAQFRLDSVSAALFVRDSSRVPVGDVTYIAKFAAKILTS